MEEFQDRVIAEQAELNQKLRKLEDFIISRKFEDLPTTDQALLTLQATYMQRYSAILKQRIERF